MADPAAEQVELDRERLAFEQKKWAAEHAHKEAGLRLKKVEHKQAGWRNPLVVAILAATIAALGNAFVMMYNGALQRDLEAQKSESARILEMIFWTLALSVTLSCWRDSEGF